MISKQFIREWMPLFFATRCRIALLAVATMTWGTTSSATSLKWLEAYDVAWSSQSRNSSESMPCGGGDIGLNVWVENGDLLIYMDHSGNIDENDQQLKSGRIRVQFTPSLWPTNGMFLQKLKLRDGCVELQGAQAKGRVWVEVNRSVVHVDMETRQPVIMQASYEGWRLEKFNVPRSLESNGKERSWDYNRWAMFGYFWYEGNVTSYPDTVAFTGNKAVRFFHQNNNDDLIFEKEVNLMRLNSLAGQLVHPTKNRIFGGMMNGDGLVADGSGAGVYAKTPFKSWQLRSDKPAKNHHLRLFLYTTQTPDLENWEQGLDQLVQTRQGKDQVAWQENQQWWTEFWNRSHIVINSGRGTNDAGWQVGRNYQLFRYMLACNVHGELPTRFNGGLFTFDPTFVNAEGLDPKVATPDFRAWGAWTGQNQRLVYWPMLKAGDFDAMHPQFEFYRRNLPNAEAHNQAAWGLAGCSFCEQIGSGGLPLGSHYGWEPPFGDRDPKAEVGLSKLHATYYTSQLEFAFMIHELYRFTGQDIGAYVPFLKDVVVFHFEYFQMLEQRRTGQIYDEYGRLVLNPSHALETYHGTNSTDVICALRVNLERLLMLPDKWVSVAEKVKFKDWLNRLPPVNFRTRDGHKTISPMEGDPNFISNYELPQLYPVFPWGIYGVGQPDLQIAIDTWRYGIDPWTAGRKTEDKSALWYPARELWYGWTQQAVMLARMGLRDEAKSYLVKKLSDARGNNDFNSPSRMRFPAFWGPGFDWTPDHNWGGSGMIALQEMLLQTPNDRLLILPAWPRDWDCDFKLHAPQSTIVEGRVQLGKLKELSVIPKWRKKNVELEMVGCK